MKNKLTLFMFLGAIVTGITASYFANRYIDTRVAEHKAMLDASYKMMEVVVPKRELRQGELLDTSFLAIRKVPLRFAHSDVIKPATIGEVTGHRVLSPVRPGEPLLKSHVSHSRGNGFASLIEDGKRALTFPVDILSSMSGMLRPSDAIDLLVTLRDGKTEKTMPLLTNVEILATGSRVDELSQQDPRGRYQTITLSVSAEEAARITHAKEEGTMTVTLRSPEDDAPTYDVPVTKQMLLGKLKRKHGGVPAVEIIRGGKKAKGR